eukprot:COSAG02_NODE_776_length_17302_cov_17.765855_5_plen_290_part_00
MQLQHEGRPEYVHWQQSIGAPGAAPGRDFLRSRQPTTSSLSARKVKEPVTESTRRKGPRVPTYLPRFELPSGAEVLGRSGAQPLPPMHERQLHSARARLYSGGRPMLTMRGGTPREALPFRGPPGQVGRIKSNARVGPVGPRAPPVKLSGAFQLKAAFKRGAFSGVSRNKHQQAHKVLELAKLAKEAAQKKRRMLEMQQQEVETLMASLRHAFKTIDKDGSGTVEPAEVLALVKAGGQAVNEIKFWDNFNKVDKDHNGLIDEEEFLKILTEDVRASRKPVLSARLPAIE